MKFQKIEVIVNPAAGQDEPIVNTLNEVFKQYDVEWQVSITQASGDAERLTKTAVANGADLVAGYGGDGTLMEVVNGLRGSGVPFGILPGGTANGFARNLNVPLDLAQAAELFCTGSRIRKVDLGEVNGRLQGNGRYFLLHAYIGMSPDQMTVRESKDKLGILAYLKSIVEVIKDPVQSVYSLTIDGQEFEGEGMICAVVNSLGLGIDFELDQPVRLDDGLLDIFLINKDLGAAVKSLVNREVAAEFFQHWQGRDIMVRCEMEQDIWVDGEPTDKTPFSAKAAPNALRVVVPLDEDDDKGE